MMLFGGGSGIRAPASIEMSPMQAAGLPPIRVIPVPPPPPGVVIPGPWGVPVHTGGGAFGIGHVCWSPILHAGLFPIRTVMQAAPSRGDPCMVVSPNRAAGRPIHPSTTNETVKFGVPKDGRSFLVENRHCVEMRAHRAGPHPAHVGLRRNRTAVR